MRTLLLPLFGNFTLREIGVTRCDRLIKQLAMLSYSRAKQARVVLRLALELVGRHEVLSSNPMDHVFRLHREPHIPGALTATAVNDKANVELAAELRGHTDTTITVQHYIRRSELVNPATVELLDRAFARRGRSELDEVEPTECHCGRVRSVRIRRRDIPGSATRCSGPLRGHSGPSWRVKRRDK
ncbi:MAG: hypothetical protein LH624_14440 [Cryobacterium sp.]|nr:hypothetical protein [Cryobacterium sp.]